jgi:carbonic anhydrase
MPLVTWLCPGTREIVLIHHTDRGMLTFTDDGFKRAIQDETGIKPAWSEGGALR